MTAATQEMLERKYKGQVASELVFKDSKDKQIGKISNTFERTVKELGFNNGVTDRRDKVTFHTCRQSIFKKQIVLYVRVTGSINRS